MPAPEQTSQEPPKKSNKKLFIVIAVIILAIVIVSGAGAAYYFFYMQEPDTADTVIQPETPPIASKSCDEWYNEIEQSFEDANFCQEDSDCTSMRLGGKAIAFGCYKYINVETDTDSINEEIKTYYTDCSKVINKCAPAPDPVCIDNKCIAQEEVSSQDSDNDGLTDLEEQKYGTDINNPDTDGDGFLDGDEIKKGYNPLGEGELDKLEEVVIECADFPDKLSACEKYECMFTHPFTGETLKKEIKGIIDGKCQYIEQMPNNGKMECNYSEASRKIAAQYYEDIYSAESGKTEVITDLGTGETKTTYMLDGKEVENPLQEFLNNGTCIVSGYE